MNCGASKPPEAPCHCESGQRLALPRYLGAIFGCFSGRAGVAIGRRPVGRYSDPTPRFCGWIAPGAFSGRQLCVGRPDVQDRRATPPSTPLPVPAIAGNCPGAWRAGLSPIKPRRLRQHGGRRVSSRRDPVERMLPPSSATRRFRARAAPRVIFCTGVARRGDADRWRLAQHGAVWPLPAHGFSGCRRYRWTRMRSRSAVGAGRRTRVSTRGGAGAGRRGPPAALP